MIELLQPMLPAVKPRQLIAMDQYQTMMGEIQDIDVMLARVAKLVATKTFSKWWPSGKAHLERFRQVLLQRRQRLIRAYLGIADHLFSFWSNDRTPRRLRQRPSALVA